MNTSWILTQKSDFILTSGSLGFQAASDGIDMGANISLVGVQPLYVTSFSGSGFTIQ